MSAVAIVVPIVVVLFIVIWLLSLSIYVIKQAEGVVLERFGRFDRILTSGLHFVVPFIDQPRSFQWKQVTINPQGGITITDTSLTRIDKRESVFNFPVQEVYTRDTILLDVDSIMYYRIYDIKKAVYEVEDLNTAIGNVAQTQLKEVFGNMTFTEALASQQKINDHMKQAFGERFREWGIEVERMELLDMTPKKGTSITAAMKRQMIAERTRRAEFITAEGSKSAMRLVSEGTKLEKYNLGVAEQEATRKLSEGQAGAKVEIARAESKSLDIIASAFEVDGASQTEYLIGQRYIGLFQSMANSAESKILYLPYETNGLSGMIASLRDIYGPSKCRTNKPRKAQTNAKTSSKGDYDDLN